MRSLTLILFFLGLAAGFAHGQPLQNPPADFQAETLDPRRDVQTAGSIVRPGAWNW